MLGGSSVALLCSPTHLTSYSQTNSERISQLDQMCSCSQSRPHIERSSISVSYKSECTTQHLPSLWLHVLKLIIFATQDGQGDRQRVQQVMIRVITAKPLPRPLFQLLNNIWSCRLEFGQNLTDSTTQLQMRRHKLHTTIITEPMQHFSDEDIQSSPELFWLREIKH